MCYKSYVGCSTDFEKTIDELRKRKFGDVLHQTSATWANVSITPGRKRATKYSRLRALQGLSGCRFQASAVVLRLCRIQDKATWENETDVRATPCATPTNEKCATNHRFPLWIACYKISVDSRPGAARKRLDGAGIGQKGRASRKTSDHSRTMIDFSLRK